MAAGATANTLVGPGIAVAIGMGAGFISVWGFNVLMPRLEKLGLRDTCGIHNLHGMPGVYAGIVSAVAFKVMYDTNTYGSQYSAMFHNGASQGGYQMAGLVITLGIAIVGGFVTSLFVKFATKPPRKLFSDSEYYHMPEGWEDIDHKKHDDVESLERETVSPTLTVDGEVEMDVLKVPIASMLVAAVVVGEGLVFGWLVGWWW